jgi:hypothetical protein
MPTNTLESSQEIYQIKVTLLGTRPPIWRRLLAPAELTLAQLHEVLQIAMGWENCHLHEFRIGGLRFGVPDPGGRLAGAPACIPERKVRLSDVFYKRGAKAQYTYDFGDSWEHVLLIEKILAREAGLAYPLCTDGKLHGPPEDCGGIGGFYNFLEAIREPDHEQHQEMLDWIGSFDPEQFSLAAVNQGLQKKFHSARKTAKRAAPKPKPATSWAGAPPPARKRIRPDEKLFVELNDQERELIMKQTFAEHELTDRLRLVHRPGDPPVYSFTLDELDELAGYVAAEANHAKEKKLQKQLIRLYDRIAALLESYTDEEG